MLYLRVDQLWHNTTHPNAYTEPTSHSVLARLRLGPSCREALLEGLRQRLVPTQNWHNGAEKVEEVAQEQEESGQPQAISCHPYGKAEEGKQKSQSRKSEA